jgi:hypothetical protein
MKKLIVAAMIAAFGSAVVLPAITNYDSAYAATKKSDKKKTAKKPKKAKRARKVAASMLFG